jgi:hypothetical protein
MAIAPGRLDIAPQRRADYPFELWFEDSEGNPVDLTNWQIIAQIWNPNRTQKLGDFVTLSSDPENGVVSLNIPFTTTSTLPYDARYDVMLINPDGIREYYLEGLSQASEGYTAP